MEAEGNRLENKGHCLGLLPGGSQPSQSSGPLISHREDVIPHSLSLGHPVHAVRLPQCSWKIEVRWGQDPVIVEAGAVLHMLLQEVLPLS